MEPVITEIFNTFALPVAVCVVLFIFLWKVLSSYKEDLAQCKLDIKELNDKYHEDYAGFIDALNNNTNVIERLCEKLNEKGGI